MSYTTNRRRRLDRQQTPTPGYILVYSTEQRFNNLLKQLYSRKFQTLQTQLKPC